MVAATEAAARTASPRSRSGSPAPAPFPWRTVRASSGWGSSRGRRSWPPSPDALAGELADRGWERDERPFRAHLTLGRADGVPGAGRAVAALADAAATLDAAWTVDRLVVYRSDLGHGPARYRPLATALLGGGGPCRDRPRCGSLAHLSARRCPSHDARAPRRPPCRPIAPSSCSTRTASRGPGTTSSADLPGAAAAGPPPGHRPADRARRPGAALPDGAHQAGRQPPSARSRSPTRSATPTGSTGRARSTAPIASSGRSIRRPTSTTSTRASARRGSHKPNTALAQAFYNQRGGRQPPRDRDRRRPVGQRPRLRRARVFGLEVKVYMVRASYDQKPYRRILMETYGAEVVASPSPDTDVRAQRPGGDAGPHRLARPRDQRGDRGHRDPSPARSTRSGSVFDFVLLHQTVIGQEAIEQMAMAGEEPDVIIGCAGGGSNFAGLTFPLLGRTFRGGAELPGHRRRARGGAVADPRRLRLRLRRHREDDAARQDAHARPRLHPRADPRRRAALPRHVAARQPAQGARVHRGPGRPPAGDASRPASCSPGPRGSCRRPSRPTRSRSRSTRPCAAKEAGSRPGHPLQPVRPRPLRPVGLRALPGRGARGLRVPGREGRAGPSRPSRRSAERPRRRRMRQRTMRPCPASPAGTAAARSTRPRRSSRSSSTSAAVRAAARR